MERRCTEEIQRPGEWLLRFVEDRTRYHELFAESDGLAVAAYRLARARCRIQPVPSAVPTQTELWAAARRIIIHVEAATPPPSREHLVAECEEHGLAVIRPIAAAHAA